MKRRNRVYMLIMLKCEFLAKVFEGQSAFMQINNGNCNNEYNYFCSAYLYMSIQYFYINVEFGKNKFVGETITYISIQEIKL